MTVKNKKKKVLFSLGMQKHLQTEGEICFSVRSTTVRFFFGGVPLFLGEKGIYAAVPLAEAVTTILGFILWRNTLVIKQVMGR